MGPSCRFWGWAHVRGSWHSGLSGAGWKGRFGRSGVVGVAGRQRGCGAPCEATDGGAGGRLWEQWLVQPAETAVCGGGQEHGWGRGLGAREQCRQHSCRAVFLSILAVIGRSRGFHWKPGGGGDSGQAGGAAAVTSPWSAGSLAGRASVSRLVSLSSGGLNSQEGVAVGLRVRRGVCLPRPHFWLRLCLHCSGLGPLLPQRGGAAGSSTAEAGR